MQDAFYRVEGETLILKVRVQPGARSTGVTGVVNGELRLRLNAPATDGRANALLREFVAERLATAVSRVHILRGITGRSKTLAITGAQRKPESLPDT